MSCRGIDLEPIPAKPILPSSGQTPPDVLGKRKRGQDEMDESPLKVSKKAKGTEGAVADVIVVEDDGVITLE